MEQDIDWKEIPDLPGYYCTQDARIYSKKSNKELIPNYELFKKNKKYACVGTRKNGQGKIFLVHVLIAKTWIDNPKDKPTVDHIDRDIYNNHIDNLRWATPKEQAANRIIENRTFSVKRTLIDENVEYYYSAHDASQQTNISKKNILYYCNNKKKSIDGSVWKWIDDIIENEIWKDIIIDSVKTKYQVSDYGGIKSNVTKRKLKLSMRTGYFSVSLTINNIRKSYRVHRLVAIMFIPNTDLNKVYVDHVDRNRQNNHVTNLRWTTPKENTRNTKKYIESSKRGIVQLSKDGTILRQYKNIYEAKRAINKNLGSHILEVCLGKYKSAHGFMWKFVDDKTPFIKYERINKICKGVIQFTKTGEKIAEYKSITDALRAMNKPITSTTNIKNVCNNTQNLAYNFKWKWKEAPVKRKKIYTKVVQFSKEGEKIAEYGNIREALKAINKPITSVANIRNVCNNSGRKFAFDFKWAWKKDL